MSVTTGTRTVITLEGDVQVVFPNAISMPTSHTPEPTPLAYTLDEAVVVSKISYNKLLNYITAGDLVSRKNGRHHLILHDELIAFLHNLPTAVDGAA